MSGYDHCLADLLYRHSTGELDCELVTVISNHPKGKPLADFYGILLSVEASPKQKGRKSEEEMLGLLGH